MRVVIKQGSRGKWRWTAYRNIGFDKYACIALAPVQGFDTEYGARRAADAALCGKGPITYIVEA